MFGRKKPEVLVVGAGPVGLCAALSLSHQGIPVRVIDKQWRIGARSCSLALHGESLRVLDKLGLYWLALQKCIAIGRIGFYEGHVRKAEIRLDEGGERPALIVLPQDELESLLEAALASAGSHVLWSHELSRLDLKADRIGATIYKLQQDSVGYAIAHTEWVVGKSFTLDVPFVIGADGHQSHVRHSLGIPFPEVGPSQRFVFFEFQSDFDMHDEARIVIGEHTTDVLWPLPNRGFRWSFEVPHDAIGDGAREKDRVGFLNEHAKLPILSDESFSELIAQRAPWFTGRIERVTWRSAVRFEHRLAGTFSRDRVGLAGDAAHLVCPIGAQGMNVGLAEASELASMIAQSLHGGQSGACLEAYHHRSQARARFFLGLEGGLECGVAANEWVSAHKDRLRQCLPASGPDFEMFAKQLGLHAEQN